MNRWQLTALFIAKPLVQTSSVKSYVGCLEKWNFEKLLEDTFSYKLCVLYHVCASRKMAENLVNCSLGITRTRKTKYLCWNVFLIFFCTSLGKVHLIWQCSGIMGKSRDTKNTRSEWTGNESTSCMFSAVCLFLKFCLSFWSLCILVPC